MRNEHRRNWNMARKLKIMENEKHTRQVLEYGQKRPKTWKTRNAHCRTWNIVRNSQKCGKREMHTVRPGVWQEN